MGTAHRLRWHRPWRHALRLPALFLWIGIVLLIAVIGLKAIALWLADDVNVSRISPNVSRVSPPRAYVHAPASVHPPASIRTRVIDGDTLDLGHERFRLIGIDAPELHQTCDDAQGRTWACGRAARKRLVELVNQVDVSCVPRSRDRYGRALAVCSAGAVPDLGEALVRDGYAVNYSRYTDVYLAAENEARAARRGIWQGRFENPEHWRHRRPQS
jgi:endonuclease YncB( thermonuclease family)